LWGWKGARRALDIEINLSFITTVFALPAALRALELGTPGREL
jgi:hypothetical protein